MNKIHTNVFEINVEGVKPSVIRMRSLDRDYSEFTVIGKDLEEKTIDVKYPVGMMNRVKSFIFEHLGDVLVDFDLRPQMCRLEGLYGGGTIDSDFYGADVIIFINQIPFGYLDESYIFCPELPEVAEIRLKEEEETKKIADEKAEKEKMKEAHKRLTSSDMMQAMFAKQKGNKRRR